MAPPIEVRDLTYSYFESARPALSSCSLSVQGGSCCAVLGPSDAGKSTLLQILSGITGSQITTGIAAGSVIIGDKPFSPIPPQVLFPFVGFSMSDPLTQLSGIKDTVADEIAFTLDNLSIQEPEYSRRLQDALRTFGLDHLASRRPSTLSGGELQRLALASIIVANPSSLLLDEPANALDSLGQQRLVQIIRSLKGKTTVIVADHQVDLPFAVADQFLVLDAGSVVFDGTRSEFLRALHRFEHLLPLSYRSEVAAAASDRPLRPSLRSIVRS